MYTVKNACLLLVWFGLMGVNIYYYLLGVLTCLVVYLTVDMAVQFPVLDMEKNINSTQQATNNFKAFFTVNLQRSSYCFWIVYEAMAANAA